jgi:hypothetical protein
MMDIVPLQPRPEFIQLVGPVEYSIVESDFYHFERPGDGISITWAMNGGFESAICVKPLLRPLIEKGDYLLDISDMWERMTLLVDGEPKEPYGSSGFGAPTLLGAPNLLSEEEQETQWLTGTDYCWRAPLETGVHDVVFQIRQTSGDVHEYQWLFEIVD